MKYYGEIGFGITEESKPGVWKPRLVQKQYSGELMKTPSRNAGSASKVNEDLTLSNQISIIADPFAYQHFSEIRYIEYMGVKWRVATVEVQHPRLILTTGGVYNGEAT